jgi:hypothetical protein
VTVKESVIVVGRSKLVRHSSQLQQSCLCALINAKSCWDNFLRDSAGDCNKLSPTFSSVYLLRTVFPISLSHARARARAHTHTASLTKFPDYAMNRCFVQYFHICKRFLVKYKQFSSKIMRSTLSSLLKGKTDLAWSKNHTKQKMAVRLFYYQGQSVVPTLTFVAVGFLPCDQFHLTHGAYRLWN